MKLLVSVRSAAEAHIGVDGGADVIDVKEPSRGSLGRADSEQLENVLAAVSRRVPVSAALGELSRGPADLPELPRQLAFAKIGLSQCRSNANWPDLWQATCDSLPAEIARVAVVYVDWQSAGAPAPCEVLKHAGSVGCSAILFDTFQKHTGNLFAHASPTQIASWLVASRAEAMQTVLAGSLSAHMLPLVFQLGPDYVAVRGAACRGGRNGPLCLARIRQFRRVLDTQQIGAAGR